MSKRFVAFDLETAKILDNVTGDLLSHRPLGITCAVAIRSDRPDSPIVWHGRDGSGAPTASMASAEAAALLTQLESFIDDGYSLATWNGLGFDFAVLADESGLVERCARLAERHVDMLFHAFCALGFRFGLQSAAEGMRLAGKTKGMSGAMAPLLWAEGRYDEVIKYCIQDTRTTLEIATAAEQSRKLYWKAKSGSRRDLALPSGWLTVGEANALPLPDTSWMRNPPSREEFFRWFPGRTSALDNLVN
jgi:hypothetical protein